MFQQVSPHVYIRPYQHYTDRPNIGLIAGSRRTLLFEAGNSADHVALLRSELTLAKLPQPDLVAVSHWHWDHSFAMRAWNIPTIAGQETGTQLQKMSQWKWDDEAMEQRIKRGEEIRFCTEMIRREYPNRNQIQVVPADILFEGSITLDLGDVTCRLIQSKGPHASDSIICYIPEDRFLFLGDSNCKDLYGKPWHFDIQHEEDFFTNTAAIPYDPELVDAYLRLLQPLDFTHCISGHADVMTKEELFRSFD